MAEHHHKGGESIIEKIAEKIHHHDSSSDSDSDYKASDSARKSKVYRLFGRQQPVHKVLGGGKPADVLLWRDKKTSAFVLGSVTVVWMLFEVFGYHLLTLICHLLILTLSVLFLWSHASSFLNKSPPQFPVVNIPENPVLEVAAALRYEINRGLASLREIASGRDLKKFLAVIAGLWVFSIVGSSCNFLTLFYLSFLLLHTVPVLYEKYEDHVDGFGEKAMIEFKQKWVIVEDEVLSKIPMFAKEKKRI